MAPGPITLARLVAVLAAPGLLAAAPAAHAVQVDHVQATATEVSGNGDGLLGPGEGFSLTERIKNVEPGFPSLTSITSTLSYTGGGGSVNLTQASSAYPNLGFGAEGDNTTPFAGTLGAGLDCGVVLDFQLDVSTAQGTAQVPFKLGTGAAGPPQVFDSVDVPRVVPDLGTTLSTLEVAAGGRVKDLKVRLGDLEHTAVGDLKIELIAPDGASVVLVDKEESSGDNFTNTVFADSAAQSIEDVPAPFTGTYRPEQPLSTLAGHAQQGTWKLKVSDELGSDSGNLNAWGMDVRQAVCDGSPIASFVANPNPVLPGATTVLDASESVDPNGTITKFEWDLDNNGTFEVDNGTDPTLEHSFPVRGSYPVKLRVTDDSSDTDVVTVNVSVSTPPVADFTATPASPLSAEDVTFNGSASSDPDGAPLSTFEWDLDGDGTFETNTGTTATTTTQYPTPGVRAVKLRVTDQDGATDVAVVEVTVQNRLPTAAFTVPDPAIVGTAASFNGSGSSDPDGSVALYEWDLDGNGSFETNTGASPTANFTYSAAGDVTVTLRVTDDAGDSATHAETVHVTRAPVASFTATPNPTPLNQAVSFNGSASSDPDGQPLTKFEWDLDGNGSFETDTGTTPTASRSFAVNGTTAVKLRVTDAAGATGTHTVNVVASNGVPFAALSAAPNPAVAGQSVLLDASASNDPDGTIVKYDWDLDGNGTFESTTGAVPTRSHAYPNPGSFSVGVRVTDNDGSTRTATASLSVQSGGGTGSGGSGSGGSGSGGSGSGGSGSGSSGGGGVGRFDARLTGTPIQRLRAVVSRGLALGCGADRAATCRLRAELRAGDARRLGLRVRGRRPVTVGTVTIVLSRSGTRSVRLALSRGGRRALRRARRVALVVRGTATAPAGGRLTLARTFLLRP
jgi:subtilisin-like proprotein convertase family protein